MFVKGVRPSNAALLWGGVLSRPTVLYSVVLCVLGVVWLTSQPIIKIDTDLWFHLSWGRYLFEQQVLPQSSSFSFMVPPRDYLAYSWMFDALVYLVKSHAGYYGLIGLRSAVYLVTFILIFRYLFWDRGQPAWRLWRACVFGVVWMIMTPHYLHIRPFLFTHLFVVLFIYIIERHPRRASVLPFLAILWCNLHGIAYPFLLLITGSYALEYLWGRFRGAAYRASDERLFFVPVILSMGAIFITPHGVRLLSEPFRDLGFLSQSIAELTPFPLADLLTFEFVRLAPTFLTRAHILILMAVVAIAVSCLSRRARISHLLMGVAGLVLVAKGPRFVSDCALLALPLLTANSLIGVEPLSKRMPAPAGHIFIGILMVIPMAFAATLLLTNRPRYPFSDRGLPAGLVAFLHHVEARGDVLNFPNNGGYLRWSLEPQYRIFMDMEHMFTDEDFYMGFHIFLEEEPLRKALTRYDPSWITVPIQKVNFRALVEPYPDYTVVFFDDAEVLYVNRRHYPAIARRYELTVLDPFEFAEKSPEDILAEHDAQPLLRVLSRIAGIYPGGAFVHELIALQYNMDGAYDRALPHAEVIIAQYPERPRGYRLKGDALSGLGLADEALAAYTMAMKREDPERRREIAKSIGLIHLEHHRYAEAYKFLSKAMDIFSHETTLEDLYWLGSAARLAGKTRVAEAALTYLYRFRVAPDQTDWIEKLQGDLAELGVSLDDEDDWGATAL